MITWEDIQKKYKDGCIHNRVDIIDDFMLVKEDVPNENPAIPYPFITLAHVIKTNIKLRDGYEYSYVSSENEPDIFRVTSNKFPIKRISCYFSDVANGFTAIYYSFGKLNLHMHLAKESGRCLRFMNGIHCWEINSNSYYDQNFFVEFYRDEKEQAPTVRKLIEEYSFFGNIIVVPSVIVMNKERL